LYKKKCNFINFCQKRQLIAATSYLFCWH